MKVSDWVEIGNEPPNKKHVNTLNELMQKILDTNADNIHPVEMLDGVCLITGDKWEQIYEIVHDYLGIE